MSAKLRSLPVWDAVGATLSTMCLAHCAGAAALILLPGLALASFASESVHVILALVLVPVTLAAFLRPARFTVAAVGASGLGCLLIGALFHRQLGADLSTAATVLGSALLLAGHGFNFASRWRRRSAVSP